MSKFIELTVLSGTEKLFVNVSTIRYVQDDGDYSTVVIGDDNSYPSILRVKESYKEIVRLING